MDEPYGEGFARHYDDLYRDKNYNDECDLIEEVFSRYSESRPRTVLDAGCGSGGHALELARRGYEICGVDRSTGLLARAREKASTAALELDLIESDLRSMDVGRRFDACICMFAVLSFQIGNDDVQAVLRTLRRHLNAGGLLVADVWHGTAVLTDRPERRLKLVALPGKRLFRFATPKLEVFDQTNSVEHWLLVVDDQKHLVIDEVIEVQKVRYFFPQELAFHLDMAGFDVLSQFPFPDLHGAPGEQDWDLGVVARARA